MDVKIVTAASSNHFKSVLQLLNSLINNTVIFYDLGLTENEKNHIKSLCNVIYKKFNYSVYPSFFDVNVNAGEYAWKSAIIKEVSENFNGIVIWSDAGNIFYGIQNLVNIINENGIYTAIAGGIIKDYTDHRTIDILSKKYNIYSDLQNRNAACIGFNTSKDWVRIFINEWFIFSSNKNCIGPENYNRMHHRHDQSILSIMYYNYIGIYNFSNICNYIDYTIHNDID